MNCCRMETYLVSCAQFGDGALLLLQAQQRGLLAPGQLRRLRVICLITRVAIRRGLRAAGPHRAARRRPGNQTSIRIISLQVSLRAIGPRRAAWRRPGSVWSVDSSTSPSPTSKMHSSDSIRGCVPLARFMAAQRQPRADGCASGAYCASAAQPGLTSCCHSAIGRCLLMCPAGAAPQNSASRVRSSSSKSCADSQHLK